MLQNASIFGELTGKLGGTTGTSVDLPDKVILSQITGGSQPGTIANGIGIKYVARGTEYYTIRGRTYPVAAGQFLCVSQRLASEVAVKSASETTLGLCLFIHTGHEPGERETLAERPIVRSAACSSLGTLLESATRALVQPAADRRGVASGLVHTARTHLELLLHDAAGHLASLRSSKPATRYELLRKLEIARAYLHAITARPVDLSELAQTAGMSRFELLRHFKDCYGMPPGTYHRQLRLSLARRLVESDQVSCEMAAHRYGFASGSSFSHAFRRAYGRAPVWDRLATNRRCPQIAPSD